MPGGISLLTATTLGAAGAVCLALCLAAEKVGRYLNVMDHPNEDRKRHARPTPQIGGIAIMVAVTLWLAAHLVIANDVNQDLLYALLFCGLGVAVVGFADDQASTSPLSRILSLSVFLGAAFVIAPSLYSPGIHWTMLSQTALPAWLYYGLAVFAALGLVNAVNMADGQNGIVLGMFVIWSVCLVVVGHGVLAAIAQVLLLTSLIAAGFNIGGRLFLGDCGTYGVTFLFALLAIYAHARGEVSSEAIIVWFFIPVVDCLRVIFTRMANGRSPLDGGRDHFHHRLQDRMGERFGVVSYVGAVAVTSLAVSLSPELSVFCLVALASFYFSFAWSGAPLILGADALDGKEEIRPVATMLSRTAPENIVQLDSRNPHFVRSAAGGNE